MRTSRLCPKCGSADLLRVPDTPGRYASGNNIYTTNLTLRGKIPVIRYVCLNCGFTEHWVERADQLARLEQAFAAE